MKQLKVLLPIFAILLAIGASAYSVIDNAPQTVLEQKWYDFVGDDPNDPLDYQVHMGAAPTCNSGTSRCAVKAVQDTELSGDFPDLNDPSILIRNKP